MALILLGIYLILFGLFALISVNIPAWVMAVFAIIVGAVLLIGKFTGRPAA